jgi:broad specificity phosphatase PhoE
LATKTAAKTNRSFQVVNRIVIEELEAWFFGDWQAVRNAYPRVPPHLPTRFREPDAIGGGTWEAFERVLKRAGYFETGLRKLECAKAIASRMCPERNVSQSFRAFREAIAACLT